MKNKSFFTLDRGFLDDPLFKKEPFTEREAMIYLIENAAFQDRDYRVGNEVIKLKTGQLSASLRYLAEAWGWSKNRVDGFLKRFEKWDRLKIEKGTAQNIITICNYSGNGNGENNKGQIEDEKKDATGTAAGQNKELIKNIKTIPPGETTPELLTACWIAAGRAENDIPGRFTMRKNRIAIEKWIEDGLTPQFIVETIAQVTKDRLKADPGFNISTIAYYDQAIRRAWDNNPANEYTRQRARRLQQWRERLEVYISNATWLDSWGLPPQDGGTDVPAELLTEYKIKEIE